jgi:hypothetical protein
MALYQDQKHVTKTTDAAFTPDYKPGQTPPHSGIYKCLGCGHEVVAEEDRSFPSQNHRQHTTQQGLIRWQLLVYADHKATL